MRDSPVVVVQAQLDAYNRRDLDGFCAVFADDAQLFELGSVTPATSGKAAIRDRYQTLFEKSPQLHMAIYEVERGLIQRVHFVRA